MDAAPFKQWYLQHYGVEIGRKKKAAASKKEGAEVFIAYCITLFIIQNPVLCNQTIGALDWVLLVCYSELVLACASWNLNLVARLPQTCWIMLNFPVCDDTKNLQAGGLFSYYCIACLIDLLIKPWCSSHLFTCAKGPEAEGAAAAATEEAKKSNHVQRKIEKRQKERTLDAHIEEQFGSGRLLACISSRPGQCGRADG